MTVKIFFILLLLAIGMESGGTGKSKRTESVAISEQSIGGVISDAKTGESLAGVEVSIGSDNLKAYTDFDGKFLFKNVKPCEYKLVVKYISYNTIVDTISIGSNSGISMNIKLSK